MLAIHSFISFISTEIGAVILAMFSTVSSFVVHVSNVHNKAIPVQALRVPGG
jgi:hypothetical protein